MTDVHTPRILLVTGGAGFIGSNFIAYLADLGRSLKVVNLDALTYASSTRGLEPAAAKLGEDYVFVHADIRDKKRVESVFREFKPDTVVHFAAESHVDRSIENPTAFVETNVVGTATLLEAARAHWRGRDDVRFHHISTDEVYGSLGATGKFSETTPYDPSSPYSATKAASDHLARAWERTYRLPVTISNCSNNYGPRQFPEKIIPLMICRALAGKSLPVYGDGSNVRDWLYVRDHCDGIWTIVCRAEVGSSYNMGGNNEIANIELVGMIADALEERRPTPSGTYRDLIRFVDDRPGHDFRYAIDTARIATDLGWQPRHDFRQGLAETVDWYLENQDWLAAISAQIYDTERLGKE